jgi:hypothetical protein
MRKIQPLGKALIRFLEEEANSVVIGDGEPQNNQS